MEFDLIKLHIVSVKYVERRKRKLKNLYASAVNLKENQIILHFSKFPKYLLCNKLITALSDQGK